MLIMVPIMPIRNITPVLLVVALLVSLLTTPVVYLLISENASTHTTIVPLSSPHFSTPSRNGSTIIVDDDPGQAHQSIQNAIDNATEGDTIRIWAGTYNEKVKINKTLTVIGNGSADTIINGDGSGDVVNITANWVNVSHIKVTNSGTEWVEGGIRVYYADRVKINDTECSNNQNQGIEVGYSDWITIENNSLFDNTHCGIHTYDSHYIRFQNNTCTDNGFAGIYPEKSMRLILSNNTCESSDMGGIYMVFSRYSFVKNNTCTDSWYGIYLADTDDTLVFGNNASSNRRNSIAQGIHLYRSNRNEIFNNSIISNRHYGILLSDSEDCRIYYNSFISNNNGGVQAACGRPNNVWDDGGGLGNYYSDYINRYGNQANNRIRYNRVYAIAGSGGCLDRWPLCAPPFETGSPSLSEDLTSPEPNTGDNFTFQARLVDNYFVLNANVNFSYSPGNFTNISMHDISREVWNATIQIPRNATKISYFFYAEDVAGNNVSTAITTLDVIDNDKPEFMEDLTDQFTTTGGTCRFKTHFSDNIEMGAANVIYTFDGVHFHNNSMSSERSREYTHLVDIPTWTDLLQYKFYFNDTSGNGNWTELFNLTVTDDDDPFFLSDNSQDNATTGEDFTFHASFHDNRNTSAVYAVYRYGVNPAINESMDHITEKNWTRTVNVDPDQEYFTYHFYVEDTSGNYNSTASKRIDIADNDVPELDRDLVTGYPTTGENFTMSVRIIDNIEVDMVILSYLFNGGSTTKISMEQNDTDTWMMEIETPENARFLSYRYIFKDTTGNENRMVLKNLTVIDNDLPSFEGHLSGFHPYTGDDCHIYSVFRDNIAVDWVEMHYSFNGGEMLVENLTFIGNYTWNLSLVAPSTALYANLFLVCSDTSNNRIQTEEFNFTVVDNDPPLPEFSGNQVVVANRTFSMNASMSSDNIGIEWYNWTFEYNGKEVFLSGIFHQFVFRHPGNYTILLEVVDTSGLVGTREIHIIIFPDPDSSVEDDVEPADDDDDIEPVDDDVEPDDDDNDDVEPPDDDTGNETGNEKKGVSAVLVTLIVMIVIVIAAAVFFLVRRGRETEGKEPEKEETPVVETDTLPDTEPESPPQEGVIDNAFIGEGTAVPQQTCYRCNNVVQYDPGTGTYWCEYCNDYA